MTFENAFINKFILYSGFINEGLKPALHTGEVPQSEKHETKN